MKKKRILFLFVTLFASTLLYSQVVGVKTNLVMDAMKMINLGAEVGLSKKLTLDLYANYNPWKYKDQKMMKMLAIQPELRYWFCDKFNGHFVGFHVHGGVYQAAAINIPWGIWPETGRPPLQRTLLWCRHFLRLPVDSRQALESGRKYRCRLCACQVRAVRMQDMR